MDGTFACPDCGSEIVLKGLSPGRQVRCGWCEAWIEVPFIPRSDVVLRHRRSRHRSRGRKATWAWVGLGVAALLVLLFGTERALKRRDRAKTEGALCVHTETAKSLEKAGQFEQALAELDDAMETARRQGPELQGRLDELGQERDRLSRRAAEIRLAALSSGPVDKALPDLLALRNWVKKDPKLSDLEDAIDNQLERARIASAKRDLAEAKRAVQAGRADGALACCDRLVNTVADLRDAKDRKQLRNEAETLAKEIIAKQGVVFAPVQGNYTLGTSHAYDNLFRPFLNELLAQQGYVTRRPSSEWNSLWDTLAPYHVSIAITEQFGANYLHSESRLTTIEARIFLNRSGKSIWSGGPVVTRSQAPLPNLKAYYASLYAVGERRNEAERLLYQDAHEALLGKFTTTIRGLPRCPSCLNSTRAD